MIRPFSLKELTQATGGRLVGQDQVISRINTDTRQLVPGDLFVALTGPHFDGHDFVSVADAKGVRACVVSRHCHIASQIVVADTHLAFGQLGQANRRAFEGKVIALTGSAGKTTVKEMLAQMLSTQGQAAKTHHNLNNTIGVPMTLLAIEASDDFAVVEMGANAPGEIAFSSIMAEPDVAMLLNASEAHISGFTDLAGVRKAKCEIFKGLTAGKGAILNRDDAGYAGWLAVVQKIDCQVTDFSLSNPDAVLSAGPLVTNEQGCASCDVYVRNTIVGKLQLQVPGHHQVMNAMAVLSVAEYLGLPFADCIGALNQFTGVPGRVSIKTGLNGSHVYDDTYNASPASVEAAVDLLANMEGNRILVLADMAELGTVSQQHHARLAAYAMKQLPDVRFFGPEYGAAAPEGAVYKNKSDLIDALLTDAKPGTRILIKGAHSMHMEEVVSALTVKEIA